MSKQCRPRSNFSYRSSLIRVYTVCHSVSTLDTSKDSQTDLVKFNVIYGAKSNMSGNYVIILHKEKKKKRIPNFLPTLPMFFLTSYPELPNSHICLFWP